MPKTNFGACFEMGKVEALTQMRYASTEKDNAAYFIFFIKCLLNQFVISFTKYTYHHYYIV